MPGVTGFLLELEKLGVKTAAVSASRNAKFVLQRLGLNERFDVFLCESSEVGAAPAPQRFTAAAGELRCVPHTCVVVEDSAENIRFARQLGMFTIGIGERKRLENAHLIIPSFVGVTPTELFKKLEIAAN